MLQISTIESGFGAKLRIIPIFCKKYLLPSVIITIQTDKMIIAMTAN
jgi:hypothetical protein